MSFITIAIKALSFQQSVCHIQTLKDALVDTRLNVDGLAYGDKNQNQSESESKHHGFH